jgi:prepilin peptidase CpaA
MDPAVSAAAAVTAGLGAAWDFRVRRIPNWLTGGALLVGLLVNAWLSGVTGVALALAGAALGLAVLLPFYAMRVMGAGDVKFLAALGALVGPKALVSVAVYGGICGGLLSLAVLLAHGRLLASLRDALVLQRPPRTSGLKAPYGLAIAGGVFLSLVLPDVIG